MQKNKKEVVPLANVFTLLPTCHPHKASRTNIIALYGSFLQAACGRTRKGRERMQKHSLLDILVRIRTHKALDRAVGKSRNYQDTLKRQDKAYSALYMAGLSKEQNIIVDSVISAVNDCGAVYGVVAYRLGLRDGIRLMEELREIK